MANGGQINYSIGFNVNTTQLNQLKTSLQQIKNLTAQDLIKINPSMAQNANKELQKIKESAKQIEGALTRAFNSNLGTLNVTKFNQELKKLNLKQIQSDFSKAGSVGATAFRNMTTQVLTTNMKLRETHSVIDKMAKTMGNTVKWGVASSIMHGFTNNVRKAFSYVKSLDTSLNNIRIVTNKSAEDMEHFAEQANKAAKKLGQTTTNYTDAALIYYQQGLDDEEVKARAETTLKAANVTGQTGQEVSEQLTAVWNGYKVSAEETEVYVDKLAAVAATTASNLEELSTGMEKVASAAEASGVDIDQLSATLSTVISVTRQAPESVGTAFKTIYARLGDLAVDGEDEFGTKLGQVSSKLKTMGIDILDSQGQMRDMGTVVEEVAEKWDTWSQAQKQAAAVAMAGKRQYNNLIALFENWDMYERSLETSRNSLGTLQNQQDIYMESTAAHLKQLRASAEDLYDSLLDTKGINTVIDGLKLLVNFTSNFIDSIGGTGPTLLALGAIGIKVFSKQIAGSIATTITNLTAMRDNLQKIRAEQEILNQFKGINIQDPRTQNLINMKQQLIDLNSILTTEERNLGNQYITQTNELYKQADALKTQLTTASSLYQQLTGVQANVSTKEGRRTVYNDLETSLTEFKDYERNIKETQNLRNAYVKNPQDAKAVEKYTTSIKEQVAVSKELIALDKLSPKLRQEMTTALNTYNNALGKNGELNLANSKHVNAAKLVQETYAKVVRQTKQDIEAARQTLQGYTEALQNNAAQVANAKTAWNQWINQLNLKAKINQAVSMVGAFGQVAMAITTIKNLGSIWSNEDISTGDKILQTVTNLGFALPMLLAGIGQVNTALGLGTKVSHAYMAAKVAELGVTEIANMLIAKGIPVHEANAAAILMEAESEAIRAQAIALVAGLTAGTIELEEFQIGINNLLAESNMQVGASAFFSAAGIKAFIASLGPIAIIFVATAAIGALIPLFDKLHISAKEAGENFTSSTEAYKEASDNLASMNDELETSTSRIRELQELAAKGTISLVEKEELSNLKKENALLEAQIKLEEAKLKIQQQQIAFDAKTALKKNTYDAKYDEEIFKDSSGKGKKKKTSKAIQTDFVKGSVVEQMSDYTDININNLDISNQNDFTQWQTDIANMQTAIAEKMQTATGKTRRDYEKVLTLIESEVQNATELWATGRTEMTAELSEGYDAALEALPALIATNVEGVNDQAIAEYQEIAKKYYEGLGEFNEIVIDSFDEIIPDQSTFEKLLNTKLIDDANNLDEEMLETILGDDGFYNLKISSEALGLSMKDLVMQLQSGDITFKDLQDSANEAGQAIGETGDAIEQLSTATEDKSSLDSLFENYEDGMYLTQDEVAEMLTENPEYINYLTEVNGKYVLNEEAMRSWTTAVEEQKEAIDDMMGSLRGMSDYNEILSQMDTQGARGGSVEKTTGFGHGKQTTYIDQTGLGDSGISNEQLEQLWNTNEKLNDSLAEGKITASEYMEELSKGIKDGDLIKGVKKLRGEFDETTDSIEETVAVIGSEVGEVLMQSNKQFQRGEMSVSDYVDTLHTGVDTQQDLLEATHDLTIGQDGLALKTKKMSKEAQNAADAYNEMEEAQDELADHDGIIDMLTENAEYLHSYTDEAGNLMDSVMDDSRWTGYIQSLTNEISTFANTSESRLNVMAEALMNNTELGMNQARTLLQNGGTELQNYLSSNLAATQALTSASMGSVSGAITNTSSAIGSVLSALGKAINSFDYTIVGTPSIDPGSFNIKEFIASKGTSGIRFPGLKLKIHGEGSGGAEALGNALTNAGKYFTSQGTSQGDSIDDYLPSGTSPSSTPSSTRPTNSKDTPSGGGDENDYEEIEDVETIIDAYREVNNALSELEKKYDRLSKAQEAAFGTNLLKNLNEQVNLTKEQISLTEKKKKIAEDEAASLKTKLGKMGNKKGGSSFFKENKVDFQFNENGEITNATSVISKLESDLQADIDKWNSWSAKKQGKNESFKEKIEARKNELSDLKDLIDNYDTLIYEDIPGYANEIAELAYSEIELKFEAFHVEADLRLDLVDAYKDWQDFETELAEYKFPDNLAKQTEATVEAINKINGSGLNTALKSNLDTYTKEWDKYRKGKYKQLDERFLAKDSKGNIKKDDDGNPIFNEAAFREAIQEDIESAQEYILEQEERFQQIHDNYMEGIDKVAESYEEQLEVLEYIGNQLEHNLRMTELIKGENAYEDMALYYTQSRAHLEETMRVQSENMEYYKKMMNEAEDEEAREKWQELYLQSIETYEETLESAAETIQAEFENAVNLQLQKFDEAMGTLNSAGDPIGTRMIKTQWEIDTENADKYLDTVEKTYGIQAFANKVKQSIIDTNSISAQQKLNGVLEDQLEKLREKDKLTQYDLDRANALYEIELKKIALEEAQNNKSQMRLRRDASGNYSYQFVSDQDSVAQAQQELLEAQNNLYSLDKDAMKERQQELWDVYQEYQDLMIEYSQLSAEEREKYEDVYAAKFANLQNQMVNLGAECAGIQINLAESAAATMAQAYEEMGKGIDYTIEEIVPKWATGMDEMIAKINAPDGSFIAAMNEVFETIKTAGETAADDLEELGVKSAAAYSAATSEALVWKQTAIDTTNELKTQVNQLEEMNQEAQEYKKTWDQIKKTILDSVEAAQTLVETALDEEGDKIEKDRTSTTTTTTTRKTTTTTVSKLKSYQKGTLTWTGNGSSRVWKDSKGKTYKANSPVGKKIQAAFDRAYTANGGYKGSYFLGWNKLDASILHKKYGLATGGYTGDWSGQIGKLAFLHQKELVLNEKDTANLLAAVKLLREYMDDYQKTSKETVQILSDDKIKEIKNISNNSMDYSYAIEIMAGSIVSALSSKMDKLIASFEPLTNQDFDLTKDEKSDTINIEINADFPNANSAAEIEQALLNLTNLATQRVHKNKRG